MDRSFLADKEVITASRDFVCIRLATYENAEENEFLKTVFARNGNLENTVFTILAPDGQKKLVTPGRSPAWAFGGVSGPGINDQSQAVIDRMGQSMQVIALAFPGNGKTGSAPLPVLADVRLALNVSAADRTPLVVVFSDQKTQLQQMEKALAEVSWNPSLVGQTQYVLARQASELKMIENFKGKAGFIVVQPGTFGLTGKVIATLDPQSSVDSLKAALSKALAKHRPSTLSYEEHRRAGTRSGAKWTSATPNTDGGARRGRKSRR